MKFEAACTQKCYNRIKEAKKALNETNQTYSSKKLPLSSTHCHSYVIVYNVCFVWDEKINYVSTVWHEKYCMLSNIHKCDSLVVCR